MTLPILPLLSVLLVAWVAGRLAERLGFPSVLGELMAGILLGPPLLGWIEGNPALDVLAQVGILLMMAYIGMKIDVHELRRTSRAGLFAAIGGFATPFVLCYYLILWTGGTVIESLFVGMAAGVTALATKSRILLDLKLLDTRIASVLMASALITDTLSLLLFAGIMGLAETGSVDMVDLVLVIGKAALFFVGAASIGQFGLPYLGRFLVKSGPISASGAFIIAVLVTLAFSEGAELAGMHGILGAFIAGLFLRDRLFGRQQTRMLEDGLRQASLGFLAPVFFVTAGFSVTLGVVFDSPGLLFALVGLASFGKIIGTALFYLPTGFGWREGLVIGGALNGRGAVEIIIAQIGLTLGVISPEIFSILVFMAIATTAAVPVLLRYGTAWLERRGELVRTDDRRTGTLVIGAGVTARNFAALLARAPDEAPVRIIDRNAEACAAARALGLDVIEGNAMDEDLLAEAGAAEVRSLVALTPNPEVNALVSRMAQDAFRIPNILVHREGRWTGSGTVASHPLAGHDDALAHTGASVAFATPFHLSDWDYWFDNGRAEMASHVLQGASTAAEALRRFSPSAPALALLFERDGVTQPVAATTSLAAGDRLTLVRRRGEASPEISGFTQMVARAPIVIEAGPLDRDGLFSVAAAHLAEVTGLSVDSLTQALCDREETGSTVIADGIAVPHGHLPGVDRVALVIVRSTGGITFTELSAPIHAAFVIATSDDRRTEYLRTLASIARTVAAPGFLGQWQAADSAEAIRGLLSGG